MSYSYDEQTIQNHRVRGYSEYEATLDINVRLGDCLPQEPLARSVVDIVAQLDLAPLYARYGKRGGTPYAPEMLLGLLFHAYATGVFASRKSEQGIAETAAFRFLVGNRSPDHDTIAAFRKQFLPQLQGLFVQILLLAQEAGLLHLGNIAATEPQFARMPPRARPFLISACLPSKSN